MAKTSRSDARLAAGASAVVALALAALDAVRPYYFLQDDNRDDFLPLFVHNLRALRQGSLALFNFHQFLGIPHLAAGQTGVLYPPIYAALALSRILFGHFFAAIDLLVVGQLAAGAAGAFLLARRLGATEDASFFAAVSWGLCPSAVLVAVFWVKLAPAAMLLPWLILFSLRALERGKPRDLAVLVALRALLFFAGHPEYFVYCVLFESVFALTAGERGAPRAWLLSFPLTALLASPLLLPMLYEVRWSAGRAGPLSYRMFSNDDARPGAWLAGLVWPLARGASRFVGPGAHLGWCGAALAALGAAPAFSSRAPRWTRVALALAAVSLVWAFGVLDRPLYLLPLFNRFRFHFKLVFFAQFALILLSARGFSRWKPAARLARLACALQAANLFLVAALTSPGGLIVDSARPPLAEPLAPLLRGARIASLGRRPAAPARYAPGLGFNYATLWGLDHFAGYDPLVPAGNFAEAYGVNEDALLDEEVLAPGFAERLRRWGVRWLVVGADDLPRYADVLRRAGARALTSDAERAVYELPGARPMAYRREAPGEALPVAFGVNSARVAVDAPASGLIVLNVFRQAGFSAAIDARPAPIESTPERQLAVRVPAGRHEVVFSFEEPAFLLGLSLAAAACLSFALWALR